MGGSWRCAAHLVDSYFDVWVGSRVEVVVNEGYLLCRIKWEPNERIEIDKIVTLLNFKGMTYIYLQDEPNPRILPFGLNATGLGEHLRGLRPDIRVDVVARRLSDLW